MPKQNGARHFTQYEINPWMKRGTVVDERKAMDQWTQLKRAIEGEGVEVSKTKA